MTNRLRFTQSRVKSLEAPEKDYTTYYDTEVPKLAVRVYKSGSRVFYVVKKNEQGKVKPYRLGSCSDVSIGDARIMATKVLSKMNMGVDPGEEKRRAKAVSQTLQQLLDGYIADHNLKPVTLKDYRQKMQWGFSDWMSKPASKISESMILARHKKLTKRGKTATNGAFRPLRAVLNYGVIQKAISHNPVSVLSAGRLWHREKPRNDLIESHQLQEWLEAVDTLTPVMHRLAFKLMLFCGFRVSETYGLRWEDIDLENGLITQRDTKNGTDHELPIPALLLPEIEEYAAGKEGGFMFPAVKRDTFHGRPKRQIRRINELVSFAFYPHMARHTFTTVAEAVGIPKTMIDRLTNHTTTNSVTAGYIHTETETLREAINKISVYIQARVQQSEKLVRLYG